MKYSDFYLVPKMSIVSSRSECDTGVEFGGYTFILPIIPSNMTTVIDFTLAERLARRGYFYIMHRFVNYPDIIDFIRGMNTRRLITSISVGVKAKDRTLVDKLIGLKLDYITLDVAHCDSILGRDMIKYIKKQLPDTYLIAGNIGSVTGAKRVEKWGADCIKIGIGPSAVCRTTPNTGFHSNPAVLLSELEGNINIPIIADGAIREMGSIAKALTLGATMCMVGGMLSGFDDSPGGVFEINGKLCKIYAGSTANNKVHVEGKSTHVPLKGSLFDYLDIIEQNLKSSISYAGGKDLSAFNHVEIKMY